MELSTSPNKASLFLLFTTPRLNRIVELISLTAQRRKDTGSIEREEKILTRNSENAHDSFSLFE